MDMLDAQIPFAKESFDSVLPSICYIIWNLDF